MKKKRVTTDTRDTYRPNMQKSRRVPNEGRDVWEEPKPLNEADIAFMKRYAGRSPYADVLERIETDIERIHDKITRMRGVVPSDTGLAPEGAWDLAGDTAALRDEPGLQVGKVSLRRLSAGWKLRSVLLCSLSSLALRGDY